MNLLPQILMCPPDYYGIEYEINPWMDTDRPADRHAAQHQWHGLRDLLEQLGARITLIDPVPGLPDLVFTANAALVHDDVAVMANFRYAQRQRETPINAQWFRTHGFRVEFLPEGLAFEGAGDALFCGDTLFAGYRIRSDMRSEQLIGEMLNCRVIALPLVDPYYYHLDTCFCPLAPGIALYYPGAFDHYGIDALRAHIETLIPVDADEARHFACNAVVVGKAVVSNSGSPKMQAALQGLGFATYDTPLSEFVKAGGSAKCLTLRLNGEEALQHRPESIVADRTSRV